jgi:hypothetical protein
LRQFVRRAQWAHAVRIFSERLRVSKHGGIIARNATLSRSAVVAPEQYNAMAAAETFLPSSLSIAQPVALHHSSIARCMISKSSA